MDTEKKKSADICGGPILKTMIFYALPLIATNLLQILFNAADVAVLSIFSENGDGAVAAVGATGSLIQLIINLFVGLSVGTNVLVARCVGSGDVQRSQRIVGCSIVVSVLGGIVLLFVGVFGAKTFLIQTKCDAEVLDMATLYLKIYFLGMPVVMLYNFSTAVLRGIGDTFRPLIYLVIGGAANVALNVLFVVGFRMTVEGVAIATVAAQGISAALAIVALGKEKGAGKLAARHLKLYGRELADIVKIGLPSGLQASLFSVSNVLVQSSINLFGKTAMAANTIAAQFDTLTYQAMYGVSLASTVFVSQNYGARNYSKVKRSAFTALGLAAFIGIFSGGLLALSARPLCSLMTDDERVADIAYMRIVLISLTYFLCGVQEVFAYCLRGLGRSMTAMFVVLCGTCLFRIVWLNTVLVKYHTLFALYLLYPASWLLTALIFVPIFTVCLKGAKKRLADEKGGATGSFSL